jgi:glycogen debranching enzyme
MHGILRKCLDFSIDTESRSLSVCQPLSSFTILTTLLGSMDGACMTSPTELPPPTGTGPILPGIVTPLQGSVPHALFYDLTHDNESPLHKRSAEDALSTGALVAFSHCATGSVKGFDDIHPKLLDLVGENRQYEISEKGGIGKIKRIINHLHTEMTLEGFAEAHVHQENDVSGILV